MPIVITRLALKGQGGLDIAHIIKPLNDVSMVAAAEYYGAVTVSVLVEESFALYRLLPAK